MSDDLTLTAQQFHLRLHSPLETAQGPITHRAGLMLIQRDSLGRVALGELSPLPGFSRETLESANSELMQIESEIVRLLKANSRERMETTLAECAALTKGIPSLTWALEMLLLDALGQQVGLPIYRLFSDQEPKSITVNALISGVGQSLAQSGAAATAKNFSVLKIKILPQQYLEQLSVLAQLAEENPALRFRLDCNQGFTLDGAKVFFEAIGNLPVEYVEDPLENPSAEAYRLLHADVATPIAFDECLSKSSLREELLASATAEVAILKPMLLGGFIATRRVAARCATQGIDTVCTSTLEGPVGLLAGLHLVASLEHPSSLARAHGFGTLGIFANNCLENRLAAQDGIIEIPSAPGLGLSATEQKTVLQYSTE